MRLTLTCQHGTRIVEVEEGREGIGNVQSLAGERSFAAQFIAEVTPRCPYCDARNDARTFRATWATSGPWA